MAVCSVSSNEFPFYIQKDQYGITFATWDQNNSLFHGGDLIDLDERPLWVSDYVVASSYDRNVTVVTPKRPLRLVVMDSHSSVTIIYNLVKDMYLTPEQYTPIFDRAGMKASPRAFLQTMVREDDNLYIGDVMKYAFGVDTDRDFYTKKSTAWYDTVVRPVRILRILTSMTSLQIEHPKYGRISLLEFDTIFMLIFPLIGFDGYLGMSPPKPFKATNSYAGMLAPPSGISFQNWLAALNKAFHFEVAVANAKDSLTLSKDEDVIKMCTPFVRSSYWSNVTKRQPLVSALQKRKRKSRNKRRKTRKTRKRRKP